RCCRLAARSPSMRASAASGGSAGGPSRRRRPTCPSRRSQQDALGSPGSDGGRARWRWRSTPRGSRCIQWCSGCPRCRSRKRRWSASLALEQAQAERVELDEALGVALVVGAGVLLEGDVREAVEGVRRLAPDDARRALVELEPHGAGDALLAL